jgi:galactose mutarotase-like enzyme
LSKNSTRPGDRDPHGDVVSCTPEGATLGSRPRESHTSTRGRTGLVLDDSGIPTGEETPFEGFDGPLADADLDDGFALSAGEASFSLAGGGRRITVEFLTGYGFAQVFAPRHGDFIALEPMTAPTSTLTTGRGLRLLEERGTFRASFRIGVA